MSIRIITGESASGKTECIKELVMEISGSHPVLCCLPSELLVNRFTKSLVKTGTVMGVEVININNLGSHLLSKLGIPFYPLTGSQMARAVKLCVDKNADQFKYFGPASGYSGFIRGTASIVDELKRSAVTSSDFSRAVEQTHSDLLKLDSLHKLEDYELIYSGLNDIVSSTGCMDHLDQLSMIVRVLSGMSGKEELLPYNTVVFDGFHDFTGIQLELIKILADHARRDKQQEHSFDLVITLTANHPENSDNTEEILQKIRSICGCRISDVERLSMSDRKNPDLYMCEVPDRLSETREAFRWITELIYDKGVNPDECAVIARNMGNYHTMIDEISREFDLPVNMVSNIPLSKCTALNSLMRLVNIFVPVVQKIDPLTHHDDQDSESRIMPDTAKTDLVRPDTSKAFIIRPDVMIRLVKDPLFSWKYPVSPAFVEQLWKEKCITGEFEQWVEAAEKSESSQSEALNEFLRYVNTTLRPPEKACAEEYISWLNFLIIEMNLAENIDNGPVGVRTDQIRGLNKLIDILEQIQEWYTSAALLLGEGITRLSFSDFASDLFSTIESETYRPTVLKDPLKGIFAGSPVDSRGLSFKSMVVMGMSEGEFPASQSENSFFLDQERLLINSSLSQFGKSIDLSIKSREAEHFEDLVKRSGQALLLTRPATTGESVWEPSPFWENMKEKYTVISEDKTSFFKFESHLSNWLPSRDRCCSHQEYLMTCTAMNDLQNPELQPQSVECIRTAERVISQREGTGNFKSVEYNGDLRNLDDKVREYTFGEDYIWSASQLESIVKCPLSFFFTRLLKLESDTSGKPGHDARQKGNIVHAIFQEVFQKALEQDMDTGEQGILDIYDETVDAIMEQAPHEFGFRPEAWWNQSCLRIKRELRKGLEALMEETRGSKIAMIEQSFGFARDKTDPLEIEFEDCEKVRIRGRIDRADIKADNTYRVVDYKTSGSSGYTNSEFRKGSILQLPLYALALWKAMDEGPVTEGFYWCRDRKRSDVLNRKELKKLDDTLEQFMEFLAPVIESVKTAVTRCRNRDFTITDQEFRCSDYCPAAQFCWNYTPSSF